METEYYEDQVSEAKAWRQALPEDLHTMTPRTQAMHDTFAPEFTPEYCYQAMLDHARQIEMELYTANGRIIELTTKTPPHECPQESVTSLAASHPNLHEYIKSMEDRLARITDHYNILRAELVENNAKAMHGMFQAAAMSKDMDYCRTMTNARLRWKCLACDGKGLVGRPATQTHDAESECCPHCEGSGFVEIPELPSGTESGSHNIQDQPTNPAE